MKPINPAMFDPRKKLEEFQKLHTDVFEKKLDYSTEPIYIDRLRSDKGTKLLGFIDDVRELWRKRYGKNEEGVVDIVRRNPTAKKDDKDTTITFRVLHRAPTKEFKEVKPRFRTEIEHPLHEGKHVHVYGQMFDLLMEFGVHSRTQDGADTVMEEFEDFLSHYESFFTRLGVSSIRFVEQLEDLTERNDNGEVHSRTLLYVVRIEKISYKFFEEIQQIDIQAKLYKQQK